MRRLTISAVAWGVIWGAWPIPWASVDLATPIDDFQWLIPLTLPLASATWEAVRGTHSCRGSGVIAGGIIGFVWGGLVGTAGLFVFVFFRVLTQESPPINLPNWCKSEPARLGIWIIAGAFVGFLIELAHVWDEHTALKKRRKALVTLSDDLASRFSLSEHPSDSNSNEHIQKLAKPMD
jgi:hypothetical protein